MNFKKLIACVLSLVCLAAVIPLAGCNGGKTGGNGSETDAPKATEVPEPTPEPRDIGDETTLASSIVYAADLLNGIQGFYDSPDRDGFTVQNLTSRFAITLKGGSDRGLTSIMNANGVPLLTGGITGYVKTADGFVFGTTSSSNGRVNTNKMGIYYYEVNIRDLAFDTIGSTADVYEIGWKSQSVSFIVPGAAPAVMGMTPKMQISASSRARALMPFFLIVFIDPPCFRATKNLPVKPRGFYCLILVFSTIPYCRSTWRHRPCRKHTLPRRCPRRPPSAWF